MKKFSVNNSILEHLSVESLIPYARNSRTHSEEQVAQLAGSIREFGFTNPVLIGADNDIIAGHGRVMAARKLGLEQVPCIRLGHLSETQKRAYIIADNKLALNAGWDDELLSLELSDLRSENFDLNLIGFDLKKIETQLNPAEKAGDVAQEWNEAGMPHYDGSPKGEGGTIIVHFLTMKHRCDFFKKLNISASESAKFCWFPEKP